ncbi:MAG TPA: cobalamin-independent methionine synthase II family protein [Thermoleophilaceae bacterium]|jgi:5-methyltetrahydropteroyltriglutamate--homocysteine methyltransferase
MATLTRTIPRAEHVGSLLRPKRLLDAISQVSSFSAEDARPTDASLDFATADHEALREVEDECIREAVAKQEAAGLDCVTDGEFRRVFFMGSFDQAVSGFAPNPDQKITFRNDKGDSLEVEGRPIVAERLEKVASPGAREAEFVSGLTERPVKVTFPAASSIANPMMFRPGVTDKHYSSFEELAGHTLQILRELIDDAIAAGATYIQLDYPAYPLIADPGFSAQMQAMGADIDAMLQGAVMADTLVVKGLPDHVRTAIHLCRGNLRGMHMVSGSLDPVAEAFFSLPYDSFLVEWNDTSRMGDYSALRHVPKGPVVGMGIVSTKDPEMESEDVLLQHLEEAGRFLDSEQLALCPQCGFASEAGGNDVDEDTQWRKLELVARVADRVWAR